MNTAPRMPETSSEIPAQAVSVYGQADAYEDFPVLKAFQQYIDAEQSKARRRMLMLCVFFSVLMVVVIAVFLMLLLNVGRQNQSLNDRLVEYAMKERERAAAPIVVQPQQQQQDNSAMLAITAKLDEMQRKLDESQAAARRAEQAAAAQAAKLTEKPKGPTPEELEIARLKTLLSVEKEKLAAEKARQEAEKEKERLRQIELEKYRRKHYPEFYEKKERKNAPVEIKDEDHAELMREVDEILDEDEAVTYFNEEKPVAPSTTRSFATRPSKARPSAPAATATPAPAPAPKEYAIPVDIRGSRSRWNIPND